MYIQEPITRRADRRQKFVGIFFGFYYNQKLFIFYICVHFYEGCGSMVNNTWTSPGYPRGYPSNIHCVYKVPIPRGRMLKIEFEQFGLERGDSCR